MIFAIELLGLSWPSNEFCVVFFGFLVIFLFDVAVQGNLLIG